MSLTAINKVRALKREKRRKRKNSKTYKDFTSYAKKPVEFGQDVFNINFTKQQKRILYSVRDNRVTNVKAGHGLGKSFLSSFLVIHHVFCVRGLVITTAPTFRQVNSIIWAEIRRLYDSHKHVLGGSRNETSLKFDQNAFAFGFSTSKGSGGSNAFQGIHHDRLLIIIDESCGIVEEIDDGARSCATGEHNRILRIGNPIVKGNAFERACNLNCITLPVWDHVNVNWAYEPVKDGDHIVHRLKKDIANKILKPAHLRKDEPVKPQSEWDQDLPRDVIPGAVSIAWIESLRVLKGENSPEWMSRVEALFPGDDVTGIIPLSELKAARERYDRMANYWDNLARQDKWRIGVDVSDGKDRHAISVWRGKILYSVRYIQPLNNLEDTIILAKEHVEPLVKSLGGMYQIAVDNTGVGAGTLGTLRQDGFFAIGCKFGSNAEDREQYKDRKTELHWRLREGLQNKEIAIAPLGDVEDEVFEELAAVRYNQDTEYKTKCEPKEETKKRLKRSPDGGDAVIIAGEIKPMEIDAAISVTQPKFRNAEKKRLTELIVSAIEWQDDISVDEANQFLK